MKEELITFETAKLAKRVRFNCSTVDLWYSKNGETELHEGSTSHRRFVNCSKMYGGCDTVDYEESTITIKDLLRTPNKYPAKKYLFPAPTQSFLQKWIRERHNINIEIRDYGFSNWRGEGFRIVKEGEENNFLELFSINTKSYEEALELSLFKALELIKSKVYGNHNRNKI